MDVTIALISPLQILDGEETCIDSITFATEKVVQTAPCLVALGQLSKQLMKKWRVHHVAHRLSLVNYLLDETLYNCDDAIVWNLICQVCEETMNHQV